MKVLYMSAHEILEHDEISLFKELGHEVFSPGAYVCPENKGDGDLRPSLQMDYNPEIVEKYHQIGSTCAGDDAKYHLTKEFVDYFDIVVAMHIPRFIKDNWEVMKHKVVIWRTIGQSLANIENEMRSYRERGMKIVRYSPMEETIPGYLGGDAMIRFYKDPEEYKDWNGDKCEVVTLAQSMRERGTHCNYFLFERATRGLPRALYGRANEAAGDLWKGQLTYPAMKQMLQDNRCYFYTGTHPASYTLNFMEAFMTGIPVVAIGPKHGNAEYFPGHKLYEVHKFIQNGVNGFVSDDERVLKEYCSLLLRDKKTAAAVGAGGRTTAIDLFGKEKIRQQWGDFFKGII